MISFTRPSVQTELDRFFKSVTEKRYFHESISKSAFTQSRRKLNPKLFKDLNRLILDYYQNNSPQISTWKGNRVISIDGSLLNLPQSNDIHNEFGGVRNQYENIVSARCSFAYDVCNELVVDAIIDKRRSCEKEMALQHLSMLNPSKDILVFDRGYPAQWLIGVLIKKGFKFCFRLSTAWKGAYGQFDKSDDDEDWTMVHHAHKGIDKLKEQGVPLQIEGLRLVAIGLASGEKEILLTNLTDRDKYSIEDLKCLYHLRWGIEESYKTFKKVLHIEHFSGKTALSIHQDFHARIIMLNISSMIRRQCFEEEKQSKNKIQINKTQAIAKTKDFLFDIFYRQNIKLYLKQMLHLLKDRIDIVRPFRSFIRHDATSRRRVKALMYRGV